jgi:hypothetical protein
MLHLACGVRTTGSAALELVDEAGPVALDIAGIVAQARNRQAGGRGGRRENVVTGRGRRRWRKFARGTGG